MENRQETFEHLKEMDSKHRPTVYAVGYLEDMKKDYLKMQDNCKRFEEENRDFCRRIGLDMDAFNIELNSEHPNQDIFQLPMLSDWDRKRVGAYLSDREKMYVMEQCVSRITDDEARTIAEMYYLKRMQQSEIGKEVGHSKGYVSKKLDKVEKGEMVAAIDDYFEWKHSAPGGQRCAWAGEWEQRRMRMLDLLHHQNPFPEGFLMPVRKRLRKMGFAV